MNILITGALGFIGSHIAQHYLQKGDHVIGIDNRSGWYPLRVYNYTESLLMKHTFFSFHPLDIRRHTELSSFVQKVNPDIVIHAAALTGIRDCAQRPYECMETNALATQGLLEACKTIGDVRLVLLSSSSVYGDQPGVPFEENALLNPKSIYAISKQTVETMAVYYSRHYRLPILMIRPFSVYGPRGRMNMLPHMLLASVITATPFLQFGTNTQNKRDWTHVDDFIYALGRIINTHKTGYDVFNIGSGNPVGIVDFIKTFRKHLSLMTSAPLRIIHKPKPLYEMEITHADTTKLIDHIGVIPKTSLDKGLGNLLTYYRANRNIYFPK
ncbi:MAG: NAD-dependent epimerase/dehydratase family protein [Candidatus Gottesmanbacteria bacterium]|nr:NAD-dependent epimerase/dehydratase family protein [Candidatus Gottesmanbacteria bacterium]